MADQERKTVRRKEQEDHDAVANPWVAEKGEKLKKDLTDLLDEIDGVLENNAEEFVRQYVQRGGE